MKRALSFSARELGLAPFSGIVLLLLTLGKMLGLFAFVLCVKHISDGLVETNNETTVVVLAVTFFALVGISSACDYYRQNLIRSIVERVDVALRARAMKVAVLKSVSGDTKESIEILKHLATLQGFLFGQAIGGSLDLIGALICLGWLFYFDLAVGSISFLSVLIVVGTLYIGHASTAKFQKHLEGVLGRTKGSAFNQSFHPDLIYGLGQLKATLRKWHDAYSAALLASGKVNDRTNGITELVNFLLALGSMAVLARCLMIVIGGGGSIGIMLTGVFLANMVIAPSLSILAYWESWTSGLGAWTSLRPMLDSENSPYPRAPESKMNAGLIIQNLTFWPQGRDRPIIDGLTLAVPAKSLVIVAGKNGTGKSTLVRLVLGLLVPTNGNVLLHGQNVHFSDRLKLGSRLGYLSQDNQLINASVSENIGRGSDEKRSLVIAAAEAAGVHYMASRLPNGYETNCGNNAPLSTGQLRSVALARALYGSPELLVLDEPEAGLDTIVRARMLSSAKKICEMGGIVLVVTHDPEDWVHLADYKLVLYFDGSWSLEMKDDDSVQRQNRCS